MKRQVILEPSEDGGFTVFAPALPGCISEGNTKEEALANIREAIALYLEPGDNAALELFEEMAKKLPKNSENA